MFGKHIVTGEVVTANYQVEAHRNVEVLKSGGRKKHIIQATNHPKFELDLDFLPAAAESYHISPNPEDYILVSLPIVTADICNRNLQGFLREELAFFSPLHGRLVYQTFLHKPTHKDHINQDPTQALGVHTDASMFYIPKYDVWKVNVLTLWDRTKDTQVVQDIIDKKRTGYSMGSFVDEFRCSICGKIDNMDQHTCEHLRETNKGTTWGPGKSLSWQICCGTTFFESSTLGQSPADPTAYSDDVFI